MILCDLPYGTTACSWDSILPFEPLWKEYWRIIKPNGAIVLTAAQPFTSALVMSAPKEFRYCWVWDKGIATNFMSAKQMPLLKTEDVCIFSLATCNAMSKTKMNYNPQDIVKINKDFTNSVSVGGAVAKARKAVFEHGKSYKQTVTGYPKNIIEFGTDRDRFHPTQKPVALFEYLIKTYTNPGDTVMDNCAGSGTTAVAANNTGRKWICIERDTGYFEAAVKRVDHKNLFKPPMEIIR